MTDTRTKRNGRPAGSGNDRWTDPSTLSGWSTDPREGKDFMHRVRTFPPEVATWRKELVEHIRGGHPVFPDLEGDDVKEIRDRLDDGIVRL